MRSQSHEGHHEGKQAHEAQNRGGQLARDDIAPVAEVGKGRRLACHFPSAALVAEPDAVAGKRPKALSRVSPAGPV